MERDPSTAPSQTASTPTTQKGKRGDTLRYTGFVAGDAYQDPHKTQAGPFYGQQALVFSRLLSYESMTTGKLAPDLAVGMPEQPDAQTLIFHINPEIQNLGIDLPMQAWMKIRQLEISRAIPGEDERVYVQHCAQQDARRVQVLESCDYSAVRWFFSMSRDLNDLPQVELPQGVEVHPAMPSEYHKVWERANEAFSEHWGFVEPREEDYQVWREGRWFQPMLWQVAWDGSEPVGQVENFIDSVENEKLGRLRGYTEGISVLKPYRGKGIARALIARSLRMLKELNMQEAALTVDSGNASGALGLYENMGYRTYRTLVEWRKPLPR